MKLTVVVPAQKLITYLTATVELRKTSQSHFYTRIGPCGKTFLHFCILNSSTNGPCENNV